MHVTASRHSLSGTVSVPGSKSHTIRAVILASLSSGNVSVIRNPLPSADCLSCMEAVRAFGAETSIEPGVWTVRAPAGGFRLPPRVVDVGNSGSVLYFMTPVAATLSGWTVMTGDASICTRPIQGLLNALKQLGADGFTTRPHVDAPPAVVRGPFRAGHVELEGNLSQYVSGILIAASRISGTTIVDLRAPKEKPFLKMTCDWLKSVGVSVVYNESLDHFEVSGPAVPCSFDRTIPSDWEGVAFPLVAAVITGSCIEIANVDCTGSQGDEAIVSILQSMGADIELDRERETLVVNGKRDAAAPVRLTGGTFNCAGFPDAVPSLAVAACFAEGDTVLTDIGVCRLKETDRIALMRTELSRLGASVEEGPDFLVVHGQGGKNMHGGDVESYDDHRIAMALAVLGLALPEGAVRVAQAECCAVSFPRFFEVMNGLGAGFVCMD